MKAKTPVEKFPYMLVQKGKHSTDHYLVQKSKDKDQAALNIVQNWLDMGYLSEYSVPQTLSQFLEKETGMTESDIQELIQDKKFSKIKVDLRGYSSSKLPAEALKDLTKDYQNRVAYNKSCQVAQEAVKTKNGSLAWQVIRYHQNSEYMDVSKEYFVNRESY